MAAYARAVGIVIKDNTVLLMYRKSNGQEYWVFPGGGAEEGETLEQAVARELQEEASMEVKIDKLLYHHNLIDSKDQYFYLCTHINGEPKLGAGNEMEESDENNVFIPQWVKIEKLPELLLYPLEIRDWLIEDIKNNFQNNPRKEAFYVNQLRQS